MNILQKIKYTFVEDVLPLIEELVWEWDDLAVVVSVGTLATVVPEGFVIWSAGNDSGTVCNVERIVVDIFTDAHVIIETHRFKKFDFSSIFCA